MIGQSFVLGGNKVYGINAKRSVSTKTIYDD